MHGLSTILAIIMMVIIVISVVGLFYNFSASLTTTTMSTTESSVNTTTTNMMTQMRVISMFLNDVLIKNTGLNDISAPSIDVYINNNPANFTLTPPVLKPNEIGTVKIYDFIKKNDDISIGTGSVFTDEKAPDPCDQAVMCMNFDEGSGSTTDDSSPNDNNGIFYGESFNDGTFVSSPIRVSGKYGKALQFDGIDDYADIVNSANLNFNNAQDFSLLLWVNYGGPVNWITPLGNGAQTSTTVGYQFETSATSGILSVIINDGTSGVSKGSISALNDSQWHYITGVIDRTGKLGVPQRMYLFVDGVQQGSPSDISSIGSLVTPAHLAIGKVGGGGQYFKGMIDEVRIYNRSLTQTEIQADMQSPLSISKTLASYSFEETGQYANDTHMWVKGLYGPALSFDGINDYVNAKNGNSLNITDKITIEAWVNYEKNTSQKGSSQFILMKDDSYKFGTEYQTLPNDEFPTIAVGEGGTPSIDRTTASNGSNSVKFYRLTTGNSLLSSRYISIPDEVTTLKLHGVAKAQNVVQGSNSWNKLAWHARYFDQFYNQLDSGSADLFSGGGTFNWNIKEGDKTDFKTLYPTTTYYRIQTLGLSSCNGTGWWDDVQIYGNDSLLFYSSFEDDKLWFKIKDARPQVSWVGVATDQLNGWHHYVATYDGNYLKIYVDGVLKSALLHRGTINPSTSDLLIGNWSSGSLDEVRIYNRAIY